MKIKLLFSSTLIGFALAGCAAKIVEVEQNGFGFDSYMYNCRTGSFRFPKGNNIDRNRFYTQKEYKNMLKSAGATKDIYENFGKQLADGAADLCR